MTKMNWDESHALDKLAQLSIKTGVALQPRPVDNRSNGSGAIG
jgi:hypothetical protein